MNARTIRPLGKNAFLALFGILILLAFLVLSNVRLFVTSGPSMEPTYQSGDTVLAFRLYGAPKKGEIVFLWNKDHYSAKRVAFLPGEEVTLEGFESYWGSNTVPAGYVFVTGDNPEHSLDSRYPNFGLVKLSDIWGTAIYSPAPPDNKTNP